MDLHALSLDELLTLSQEVNTAIAQRRKAAEHQLVMEIQQKASLLGINAQDLVARLKSPKGSNLKGSKVAAQFRHPETGAEWSGRGRRPSWILAWEHSGRSVDELKTA